jgi:mono/diheme cytochrome c family protein
MMLHTRTSAMGRLVTGAAIVMALGTFAARADAQSSSASPGPAASAAEDLLRDAKFVSTGREIYHGRGNCFVCHGENLEGQIGPTLKAHAWKHAKNGEFGEIQRVVYSGAPGTAMVALPGGISPAEARAVALYVWAVGHDKVKP